MCKDLDEYTGHATAQARAAKRQKETGPASARSQGQRFDVVRVHDGVDIYRTKDWKQGHTKHTLVVRSTGIFALHHLSREPQAYQNRRSET